MRKSKNIFANALKNKRYKAIEKVSHETEMRAKSWLIEYGIYNLPLIVAILGWFMYGLMVEATLPYGQSFDFTQPLFFVILFIGVALTYYSITKIKPKLEKELDIEERELSEDVYQKGAKFCNLVDFNKQIDNYMLNEFKLSGNKKSLDTFLIPLQKLDEDDKQYYEDIEELKIPRAALATGLCIMGAPGQGKSVLINQIIKQIPPAAKQIIIDVKGEFLEKHYNPETDCIICPSDVRSKRFNLVNLLYSKIDTGIIAKTIITEEKESNDPHWVNAARAVMEAILIYAAKRNLSNKSIYKLIFDPEELKKILNDDEARVICGQFLSFSENGDFSKETKSVISTLTRKAKILQYLAYLDDLETEKIYLDKWLLNKQGGKIFLLATDNLSKVFSPLYAVIVSYFISTLLDQEDTKEDDYYFILDELPRLGKTLGENLEKALAVGRSKGMKITMAMQSYSQIKKEFGEKESESILDTTNSFIVFKNNYGAQFLEKLFGKTTFIRNNESFSFGMHDMADRSQLQRQIVTENLINESEITRLSKFEFYGKIEGSKDVLKAKLSHVFVKSNGTKKYIENKEMEISVLTDEMEKNIKEIENRYISFKRAKYMKVSTKVDF